MLPQHFVRTDRGVAARAANTRVGIHPASGGPRSRSAICMAELRWYEAVSAAAHAPLVDGRPGDDYRAGPSSDAGGAANHPPPSGNSDAE